VMVLLPAPSAEVPKETWPLEFSGRLVVFQPQWWRSRCWWRCQSRKPCRNSKRSSRYYIRNGLRVKCGAGERCGKQAENKKDAGNSVPISQGLAGLNVHCLSSFSFFSHNNIGAGPLDQNRQQAK
jgi:hypothetical protein